MAKDAMDSLLRRLGMVRYPEKRFWDRSRRFDHLGEPLDLASMRMFVAD